MCGHACLMLPWLMNQTIVSPQGSPQEQAGAPVKFVRKYPNSKKNPAHSLSEAAGEFDRKYLIFLG
jgi:hypothetical protein